MSTNKTQNYNLHSWLPADDFLRTEINENFTKLDAALSALSAEKARAVVGVYTGDGAAERMISLGFSPIAVWVVENHSWLYVSGLIYGGLAVPGGPVRSSEREPNRAVELTEGGILIRYINSNKLNTNTQNYTYHYLAIG